MSAPPLPFRWNAEHHAMVLDPRFRRAAASAFTDHATYYLVEHQERSSASHGHYFALIKTLWETLPEAEAERFPTAEHLRKYALIRAGYRDERSIVCGSKAEAQRMAAFIKPMDEYAIVTASEAVVRVWTAQSQSYRAMGKEAFRASKDAVIGVLAQMLDVAPESFTTPSPTVRSAAEPKKLPAMATERHA